ncbi:hypothetical protein ACW2Q0_24170 [Nocardia sp. R16R-3T]
MRSRAHQAARSARRKPVTITKIHQPREWRLYTERVRPLMGADDPEAHEEPLAPRAELVRYADALDRIATIDRLVRRRAAQCRFDRLPLAGDHERPYRRILTGARTSRALWPTPVA